MNLRTAAVRRRGILARLRSRQLLREYVEAHQVRQIYACWSGDEALDPELHLEIGTARITDWHFRIPERVMLTVTGTGQAAASDGKNP